MPRRPRAPLPSLRRAIAGAVAAAISLGACAEFFAANDPVAVRYDPPAIYQIWWDELQRCSGRKSPMSAVEFHRAEDDSWMSDGAVVNGVYQRGAHRIIIGSDGTLDGRLVRHEMLHALTDGVGHTYDAFVRRCGDFVTCSVSCLQEAGVPAALPSPSPPEADSLVVSMRVEPAVPVRSAYDGRAVIIVAVRNPRPYAVAVPPTAHEKIRIFLVGDSPGVTVARSFLDGRSRYFGPGETRRILFDLRVGPADLPGAGPVPGEHAVFRARATFASRWTDSIDFVVRP